MIKDILFKKTSAGVISYNSKEARGVLSRKNKVKFKQGNMAESTGEIRIIEGEIYFLSNDRNYNGNRPGNIDHGYDYSWYIRKEYGGYVYSMEIIRNINVDQLLKLNK